MPLTHQSKFQLVLEASHGQQRSRSCLSPVCGFLAVAIVSVICSGTAVAAQQPSKDAAVALGDSPADAGLPAHDLSPAIKKRDVTRAPRKVADWQ